MSGMMRLVALVTLCASATAMASAQELLVPRGQTVMRLAAILLAAISTQALALPPGGVYLDDAEHLWWECHVQPTAKVACCRASDGHVLGDNDWRTIERPNEARAYQVHVGAKWYDVPAQAVINDVRHCGPEPNLVLRPMAKIWYAPTWDVDRITDIRIYCFIAGTMY